jgi:hypothetical protein
VVLMNDQTEIAHAARFLSEELDAGENASGSLPALLAAREILGTLHNFVEVYAACFCTDGDLLSQWRGYTGRGGRYALVFRSEALSTPTSPVSLKQLWWSVRLSVCL